MRPLFLKGSFMNELYAGLADIFEIDPEEIGPETSLEDYGWDSLAIVSTIALFDELFGKEVKVDDLSACVTVSDIEALAKG
jgi:acyl carrier protein